MLKKPTLDPAFPFILSSTIVGAIAKANEVHSPFVIARKTTLNTKKRLQYIELYPWVSKYTFNGRVAMRRILTIVKVYSKPFLGLIQLSILRPRVSTTLKIVITVLGFQFIGRSKRAGVRHAEGYTVKVVVYITKIRMLISIRDLIKLQNEPSSAPFMNVFGAVRSEADESDTKAETSAISSETVVHCFSGFSSVERSTSMKY